MVNPGDRRWSVADAHHTEKAVHILHTWVNFQERNEAKSSSDVPWKLKNPFLRFQFRKDA